MEIDVRVEVLAAKSVDQGREALRDVAVAQVFAHDGVIFGFSLRVIVAVPGARFGLLFDEQLVERFGDLVIDEL